jgi:Flp pilus assembly protein TadD
LNPSLPDAHQNLGATLFKQGDLPRAITELQRAAELAPYSASVHSDLGGALAQAGRFDDAAVQLRRALEIDPGNAAARENLSLLERRLSR